MTGLKTRCSPGRPEWEEVLGEIQQNSKLKVTLYYCGAPQAADIIQPICDKLGFGFRKEIF